MYYKADRERLEAMEMWIWRRMEKISWVDKISNEEVLKRVNETKTVRHSEKMLRHESLLHYMIEGRMRGKATRGRRECIC